VPTTHFAVEFSRPPSTSWTSAGTVPYAATASNFSLRFATATFENGAPLVFRAAAVSSAGRNATSPTGLVAAIGRAVSPSAVGVTRTLRPTGADFVSAFSLIWAPPADTTVTNLKRKWRVGDAAWAEIPSTAASCGATSCNFTRPPVGSYRFCVAAVNKFGEGECVSTPVVSAVECLAATTCRGRGACDVTTLGCVCGRAFMGVSCERCRAGLLEPDCTLPPSVVCDAATTCSGRGTCRADGRCNCDVNYFGDACATCTPRCPFHSDPPPSCGPPRIGLVGGAHHRRCRRDDVRRVDFRSAGSPRHPRRPHGRRVPPLCDSSRAGTCPPIPALTQRQDSSGAPTFIPAGAVRDFGPDGIVFATPVTLSLSFTGAARDGFSLEATVHPPPL
jgi:hypothetical protein